MSIVLYRIDDRLIHGQVVVGWGQPLHVGFIVVVDDAVRASEWEQDLYRMGVPPHIDVVFASTAEAAQRLPEWETDPRPGIVLAGTIDALAALSSNSHRVKRINVGGIHHQPGRDRKSTRLNSSHLVISYAVFCLKKKNAISPRSSSTEIFLSCVRA